MKKVQEKALILSTFTSVLLSFAVVIGTVAFILLRTKQHREYDEKWKDIPNYEGYYMVSNYGRVASLLFQNNVLYYLIYNT